jgi:hypothetical protein
MRLLLTFAPIIISTQLEIFPNAVMDIVAKCMLVYGCAFTSRKASAMFSGILADSAGWQSITAGSLRSDWDQYKKESENDKEKKQQAKERAAQQKQAQQGKDDKKEDKTEKDLKTAQSVGKLASGTGDLKDMKTVSDAGKEKKDEALDNLGLGGAKDIGNNSTGDTLANGGGGGTGNDGNGGGAYSIPVPPPMPNPPVVNVAQPQPEQGDQQGEVRDPPPLNNN